MKSKKSFNLFLVCVSMFVLLLTGCNNMNGPAKENEKGNNNGTEAAGSSGGEQGGSGQSDPTPPVNGIELTWPNVPDGTVSILIETIIENEGRSNLFRINDLSQYTSILDENVDIGKEYTYLICYLNSNGNMINSKQVKIKARGGKGEKTLNVSRSDDGISLSLEDLSDCSQNYCDIYKKESGNQNSYKIRTYEINGSFQETFTDKFVDSGKSYKYRPYFQVGADDDALVEWPRYKYVSITADAGSGNIRTTTNLEASYSDSNETITATKKPVFNIAPDYCSVQLLYSNSNGNLGNLGDFSFYGQTEYFDADLHDKPTGLWTFESTTYWLHFPDEDFGYEYTEYSSPGVPQSIALRVNVDEMFLPITSTTGQGIQITWQNLPADTQIIDIQDADNGATLFRVNNLSQITSVTDKYVTNGNTYRYRIIARDQNNNWIERSGIARQKANAGLGELTFTAQAAGNGIRLTGQRASPQSEFRIYKRISSSSGNSDTIILNNSSSSFNLTDSFVSAGTEYEYRVEEVIGNDRSYWQNNVQIPADPLVEYPRFKGQTVTANGGSGNFRITNSPSVTYNDSTESVRFSTKPAISGSPVSCWIYFTYTKDSNGGRTLFGYNSSNNNLTINLYNIELAEYTFSNYYINAEFNDFSYEHTEYSLDDFGNFPQTINITGSGRIKLIATDVSEGIKLEWQNLPAETKSIEIRDNNSGYPLFTVTDLTQVTSVTDKYVTSGNTYWYYFAAIAENGRWIKQSEIISKEANNGSGELTFSAQATANGVVLTGQRAISDSNSQFRIIKKLGTTNNNEEGDTITLNESTSKSYSITDPFVTNGTNYVYIVNENIGYAWDHWNNGTQYPPDPLVIYPRFNNREITVTGACDSGDLKITNKFSITYDASNENFIFSKKPELNVTANSWSIWFNYSRGNGNGWGTLYSIGSNSNTTVGFNNYQAGQWNFVNYEIEARFDDYSYLRHETSSDIFEAIPETVTISN